jgi:hypothetical protein
MKKCLFVAVVFLWSCAGQQPSRQEKLQDRVMDQKMAVKMNPDDAKAHKELGRLYQELSRYDEALLELNSALELKPGLTEALFLKGLVLWQMGNKPQSIETFQSVLFGPDAETYTGKIGALVGYPHPIRQWSDGLGQNAFPSVSGSPERIAFQSNRDGNWEIYYQPTGTETEPIRITDNRDRDEGPVFMSGGKHIVFTTTRDDTDHVRLENLERNLYTVDVETGIETVLTQDKYDDWAPSPDPGDRFILFLSNRAVGSDSTTVDSLYQIFSLNPNELAIRPLTQSRLPKTPGSLDSTGQVYYYSEKRQPDNYAVIRLNLSNGKTSVVPGLDQNDMVPRLSHNNRYITLFSDTSGDFNIFLYDARTSTRQQLTVSGAIDSYPVFDSKDSSIYFHSDRSGSFQIYQIDLTRPVARKELIEVLDALKEELEQGV